jgi:hypothetical protein
VRGDESTVGRIEEMEERGRRVKRREEKRGEERRRKKEKGENDEHIAPWGCESENPIWTSPIQRGVGNDKKCSTREEECLHTSHFSIHLCIGWSTILNIERWHRSQTQSSKMTLSH